MSVLTGTGRLVLSALRRSRVMLIVWVCSLAASAAGTAASFKNLYGTPRSLSEFVAGVNKNGAVLAVYGKVLTPGSTGGITAWRLGTLGSALVAIMSVFLVIRHTRGDEETGRQELIGACVVGRRAPLTAGLLIGVIANLALGLLSAVTLIGIGLPAVGSFAFGLAWMVTGICFTAVSGVTAQLTRTARSARSIALGVLGVAFLLRAVGDSIDIPWLSWLSPIGWTQQFRAYGAERWWLSGLAAAFTLVAVGVAYTLVGHRDLDSGLLPERSGPAAAAPSLHSAFALAWRLQRGPLLVWTAGFAAYGSMIGGITKGVADLVKDNPGTRDLIAKLGGHQGIENAFVAALMGVIGILAAVYAVQAALRLRAEETTQRAEPLLATRVRRVRWAAGHLVFAVFGTVFLLGVAGLSAGLVHGLHIHDLGGQVPRFLGAALVQTPAAWVPAALAVLLFGVAPRLSTASWGVVGVCLLIGQLGPVLKLSQAVMDVSPFTHVPRLPGGRWSLTPILSLTLVAAVVAAAGLMGLRRRDLE